MSLLPPTPPRASVNPAPPQPAFSSLSFVAGLVSGAAGQAVGHPLDTLKVHAQAAQSASQLHFRGLWRGAAVPIATTGAINALALGVFENVRRTLWPHKDATPLACLGAAGSACGLTVSFITCPLSRVKVLQQLTGVGFIDGARHCLESRTLFRAYPTAALWEGTRGSYMVLYSLMKQKLHPQGHTSASGDSLPLWARVAAGGGANVVNIALWYPLNTVLHVQQSELPTRMRLDRKACAITEEGRHMVEVGRALLNEGGLTRLYRGLGYALVRAGPVAAVIMPCFELLLPWLEKVLQ